MVKNKQLLNKFYYLISLINDNCPTGGGFLDEIKEIVKENDNQLLLLLNIAYLEDDDHNLLCCAYLRNSILKNDIIYLYTPEKYRKQGYATALVNEIFNLYKDSKCCAMLIAGPDLIKMSARNGWKFLYKNYRNSEFTFTTNEQLDRANIANNAFKQAHQKVCLEDFSEVNMTTLIRCSTNKIAKEMAYSIAPVVLGMDDFMRELIIPLQHATSSATSIKRLKA